MTYQANKTRYDEMKYRRCGKSGILLPVMSLGMWHNFGSIHSMHKAIDFL